MAGPGAAEAEMPATVAAAWGVRERSQKGPKPALSLARIVDAGVRLADSEGLDAVSMGRVAASLDTAPMSLYRHVSSKEELIKLREDTDERLEVGELLLAPILRQLEHYPPALIAVVDKEHAKTFGSILDDIIPLEQVNGTEVRHTRAGGASAASNQRKADNTARANLESAVKSVEREMASGAYMQLYIAGPEEARSTFERMLPERLKRAVAGHLSASLDSSELKRELREKVAAAVKR